MKQVFIDGMKCRNCANMVEEILCKMENTEDVQVSLEEGWAKVIGAVSDEDITEAIEKLGYTVTDIV